MLIDFSLLAWIILIACFITSYFVIKAVKPKGKSHEVCTDRHSVRGDNNVHLIGSAGAVHPSGGGADHRGSGVGGLQFGTIAPMTLGAKLFLASFLVVLVAVIAGVVWVNYNYLTS